MYISQDPIGLNGGDRLYAYVHDTNGWIDPNGLAKSCTSGENSAAKTGRQKHKEYKKDKVKEGVFEKEHRLPSGKKIDAIDFENKTIYELKPNNPKAIRKGEIQAEKYKTEIEEIKNSDGSSKYGTDWKVVIDTY